MTYSEHQSELADVLAKISGADFVTHYVVVAATASADSETTHLITSPGLPLWMAHGLLSYEAASAQPQPFWAVDEDDEGDE